MSENPLDILKKVDKMMGNSNENRKRIKLEELKLILQKNFKNIQEIKEIISKKVIIHRKKNNEPEHIEVLIDKDKYANYYIITNENYINNEIENNKNVKEFNFEKHIFLVPLKLEKKIIDATMSFSDSFFTKEIDFKENKITGNILFINTFFYGVGENNFIGNNFSGNVIFQESIFKGQTYFFKSEFGEKTYFNGCSFEKEVTFVENIFNSEITFWGANFKDKCNFKFTKFKDNVYFDEIKIDNGLYFEKVIYEKILSLFPTNCNQTFTLNLKGLAGSSNNLFFDENIIDCLDKNTPRETYNIFKNALLARKDTVNALRYYKKEYDKHLKDTSFGVDKIILLFTKYVSYFSTAPFIAILWWIGTLGVFGVWILLAYNDMLTLIYISLSIIIVFFILIYPYKYKLVKYVIWGIFVLGIIRFIYYYNINIDDIKMFYSIFLDKIAKGWEYITKPENRELIRYAFNPLASISDGKEVFCISKNGDTCKYVNGWIEFIIRLLTFIKTILLGVITYEIVKSVRKFSRRF